MAQKDKDDTRKTSGETEPKISESEDLSAFPRSPFIRKQFMLNPKLSLKKHPGKLGSPPKFSKRANVPQIQGPGPGQIFHKLQIGGNACLVRFEAEILDKSRQSASKKRKNLMEKAIWSQLMPECGMGHIGYVTPTPRSSHSTCYRPRLANNID